MKHLELSKINRILIRSTNWIGDAVMTTPALGSIRATFPQAEIVVAANPLVGELFRYHPYCDRVLIFDKKQEHRGVTGLLRFASQLRREGFDLAILLQNAGEAAILALAAGIPRRLGYSTEGRGPLLTHRCPAGPEARRLHHTEYYRHLLRPFGIEGGDGCLRLECTAEEIDWAAERLDGGSWVAINPGAAYGSAKRWFPERFAGVADRLHEEFGASIVLTGGPGEAEIGRDIEKAMRAPALNLIGQTSVRQMMAILAGCRLMITNDSGPMHVAAAFRVPIAAVFGPTDHTTTSPLAENCRIIRKDFDCAPCLLRQCPIDHRCMEAVTAEDVLSAVREIWEGKSCAS